MSTMRELCLAEDGKAEILQGNMAFATGCIRAGIHAADGYPGTPSTEVIDKGFAEVQDLIDVGWSVNEAVAVGVGIGHTYAGRDCVVTMKIPGLFQAGDLFTSFSPYVEARGTLIFYIASDFTPSSTQHVIDPRYLYKSCFLPVFEPRNHQEMHEAAGIAADIGHKYNTAVVVQASGMLCHSEGLVRLMPRKTRELTPVQNLREMNSLPVQTRKTYNKLMATRVPALIKMVEESPLNIHIPGSGKKGVITYGSGAMHMTEYKASFDPSIDILSLAFTNPLPLERIRAFCKSIDGPVYIIEDGYRYVQDACEAAGIKVIGKDVNSWITEWNPSLIAAFLGKPVENGPKVSCNPVPRPPMICAGCPYRLVGEELKRMKKRGELEAIFGDIGCNTLLYSMNALDTCLAMGASESIRTGYVLSKPESLSKCVSILGDGTECHTGMAATRNSVFRNIPGVKIVLDNEWIAMTGGQPGPASPVNLKGEPHNFRLDDALRGQGAVVITVNAYDFKGIRKAIKEAFAAAKKNAFVTLVVQGTCIRKMPASAYGQKLVVDTKACKRCGSCLICPGIEASEDKTPRWNNLCSGCVSQTPACSQMCPVKAISVAKPEELVAADSGIQLPEAPLPQDVPALTAEQRPDRISLAIRGVGGQGNLFFGKALAQVAFDAGYGEDNIVKGDTHGMAQMGGPVISTFACGHVHSPDLVPGTADCLIAMEKSEILRPGFIDLLRPGGTVMLADTHVLPQGIDPKLYPADEAISAFLEGYRVIKVDVLKIALELGDSKGRCANVVMLGALSGQPTFNRIPEEIWLKSLYRISPNRKVWDLNHAAFRAGQKLV